MYLTQLLAQWTLRLAERIAFLITNLRERPVRLPDQWDGVLRQVDGKAPRVRELTGSHFTGN